jgi:arsenate reductase
MNIQIFGFKKDADTRKALRFFSERRIKPHFVDLREKPASKGELRRFVDRFGIEAVLDRESKRFLALGLRNAHYGPDRWMEILTEEPGLLRTPLSRQKQKLAIGYAPEDWTEWMKSE